MYYFKIEIIEQEMNKIAIHTHAIFRPHNAMFCISKTMSFQIGNGDVIVILYG